MTSPFLFNINRIEQDDEKVPVSGIAESLMDIEASDSNEELSDSDTEASDNPDADLVKERKFVCFESQIMKLCRLSVSSLCNRKGCSATVNTTTKSRGTAIKISWVSDVNEKNYFITVFFNSMLKKSYAFNEN